MSTIQDALRAAQLAVAADEGNRYEEAAKHYRQALDLMPNDDNTLTAHREGYSIRARLMDLRAFEEKRNREPTLDERLLSLRDGKTSIVQDRVVFDTMAEEQLDEDAQIDSILQRAIAEAKLSDGDDDCVDDEVKKVPKKKPPVDDDISDDCSSSEEPYSDEEMEKRRLKEVKRRQAIKKRGKKKW